MKFRLTVLISSLAALNVATAATEINLHQQSPASIKTKFSNQTKIQLQEVRSDVDFNGMTHTRIQQTYENIPVWKASGVIHTPGAKQKLAAKREASMNGVIYDNLENDLANTPAFSTQSANKAISLAKSAHLKKASLISLTAEKENASPIIFVDAQKQAHKAYLTSFTYTTAKAVHKPMTIIDANTHKIYASWEGIYTLDAKQTALVNAAKAKAKQALLNNDIQAFSDITAGGIGGNPKAGEMIYDGQAGHKSSLKIKVYKDFEMDFGDLKIQLCNLMDDNIFILDSNYSDEDVSTTCYISKNHDGIAWLSPDKQDTRWLADQVNEGYSPSLDAFYAANAIRSMYQDWLGVPALINPDGSPMKYVLRVHYGRSFDNAFWNGYEMTFGDGDKMFYPLTSLDVAAHEISHGFTETHSNIDGQYPQMAALHESFSDMAALAVENYVNGTNNWDIGRGIKKDEGALRYLDNPVKDGNSIDHMKDFDQGTEAHGGAGVTNKAFYLLANTKGWNTRKAFEVMAKANMHYWNASMHSLNEAACGVLAATQDYGYNLGDVRIAFSKVGIETDACEIK